MSYKTIAQFKTDVTPKLHGTTLGKISNVYGKLYEAASKVRSRVFPPTIIRRTTIASAIYDKVYNYTCPDGATEDSIIAIRPVAQRTHYGRSIPDVGIQDFDIRKAENAYTIEYVNGTKTLRLSKALTERTILHECDSLSDGTVTGSGDVTDLAVNYLDFMAGSSSFGFNLSGSTGQGKITFDLASSFDLSDWLNVGAFFAWLKFSSVSTLTDVTLRWGKNASNYWEGSATAAIDRAFADNAFQLLQYLWASATKTGTPDEGAIKWLEVEINYTAGTAINGCRLDNITAALGEQWEVVYYNDSLFTDSSGTWKAQPTTDSDLIALEDDAYLLLMYEFMLTLQQELKGKNMANDYTFFRTELYGQFGYRGALMVPGLYSKFEEMHPSQVPPRQETYYDFDPLDGYGGVGDQYED